MLPRPPTDDERRIAEAMRLAHRSWEEIAKRLGVCRTYARQHFGQYERPKPKVTREVYAAADLHTKPAGHPITWNAIIAGTLLEGTPWPEHERMGR